jgi:very-short-patch-repair endonuclease
VPRTPHRPADLRGSIFRGSAAVGSGVLTRHQLHSSAWRRLFPDVYACASLDVTHELRARAVTSLLLPGAVASGRTAAGLWGVALAGPDDDVEVTVRAGTRAGAVAGVHLTRRSLPAAAITTRRGSRVTTPTRTALDLARIRPSDEAVVALDQFLLPGLVFLDEVRAAAATTTGRDCRRIRAVAELADGLAESPQETRLRLLLHRSDLPRPVAQFRVRAGGIFAGRVDFAWPEHRLALEYEGRWHGERQHVAPDRRRLNRLTAAGWRVLFVTAEDLRQPARLLSRIRAALACPARSV